MKRIVLLLILLSTTLGLAQVGVNTTNPDPSSMLDISATNKGVLVPRVSLTNVTSTMLDGTNTAATGLLIWNTNAATLGGNGVGFYFFNGAIWIPLTQAVAGNTLDQSYDQGGAGVGQTITADAGAVTINGTDGLVTSGTFGSGVVAPSGAGTKMFFNPRKAAFRAGNINGTQWDDATIGNYSIAMGQNATASGSNSVAFGSSNTASGSSSVAFGSVSYATSDAAFVGGLFNTASGVASTAFGYRSVASGGASTALGNDNFSRSYGETVIGIGATDYTPLNTVSAHPSGATDRLFVVGNAIDSNLSFSIDSSERSNALVILKNGETGLGANPTTGNRLTVGGKTATTNFQMTSGAAANYILQSDAAGNATWVNPLDNTDAQQIDVFNLTGTTLNLSLQNDGVATQTVDLSPLVGDDDWTDVGADIERQIGNVFIGDTNLTNNNLFISNQIIDWDNPVYSINPDGDSFMSEIQFDSGIVSDPSIRFNDDDTGFFSPAVSTTAYSSDGLEAFRIQPDGNISVGTTFNSNYKLRVESPFDKTAYIGGTTATNSVMDLVNNGTDGNGLNIGLTSSSTTNSRSGINSFNIMGNSIVEVSKFESPTNNVYGIKSYLLDVPFGTAYGIYSQAQDPTSFAGYFLGRTSIGTTAANNYILPLSRGTNGQIMQTDATGNVTWVNPPTDTDDQATDVFSLTGNTLNLSLQNDGVATQTVDLSSLKDADWYEIGGSTPANAISDSIYNLGSVSIGSNSATSGKLDIINTSKLVALDITDLFASTSSGININLTASNTTKTGIDISLNGTTAIGGISSFLTTQDNSTSTQNVFGIYQQFSGTNTSVNFITGLRNWFDLFSQYDGTIYGIDNDINNNLNGDHFGIANNLTGTGTGTKYGCYNLIPTTAGGTHYGVYSSVLKVGSFAGYFLGRMSIGTNTANNYILPSSRGINTQIMQTDGGGNVTWVSPATVFTDTDNQIIDDLSLTGNILNISLQDDGVATQTVDLSSLANDWKLTGNAGTVAGTNFIGTTDAENLDFRTNNIVKLRLTQQGQLSFQNSGSSIFIGANAGENDDLTLNQNTFVGNFSGESTSSGNLNSALGFNSLNVNTLGLGNTAVGANALNVNVDGNNNTGLGRGANVSTTNLTNATAVGFNSTVNASNKIRLGNTTITIVEGQVAYTNPSDARFKFNVKEDVPGLDFIKKLKPVTYNFDTKKFDDHLNQNRNKDEVANEDFVTSTAIIRTGFLAQDVEKICTDLGYNFDGLHIPDASNPTDNYGIAYSQFIMPIVKAVQEQQVIIETQKTELEHLKSELEKYKTLEERIKALEQK